MDVIPRKEVSSGDVRSCRFRVADARVPLTIFAGSKLCPNSGNIPTEMPNCSGGLLLVTGGHGVSENGRDKSSP